MNEDPLLILAARRASGQDDADPAIAAALTAAQQDPALRAWADEQQRTDATLVRKLRQVQPPPGLREAILTGAKVSRHGWWAWFDKPAWRNFRNSELLAVVALVLIFAVALVSRLFVSSPSTWQLAGAIEVAKIESAASSIEHLSGDIGEIRTWLAGKTCPSPASLPPQVRGLPIFGCSRLDWRGQPISIVCFDLGSGKEVHLVTISRTDIPVEPPIGAPEYAELNGYQTASWSEGDVAMMLIGKVPREDLEKLFKTAIAAATGIAQDSPRRG